MAYLKGHKEIVSLLIEKGIDINQKDNSEQNTLHLASKNGHIEIVQLLIENGMAIIQTDNKTKCFTFGI